MSSRYRINRYNWFGQKLLAQHEYGAIISLRNYLTKTAITSHEGQFGKPQTSDCITYVHGLAMLKVSTRLDEVIFSLQQVNYDRNIEQFLLLCQCLLYIGNHESVVALCRQLINREIDSTYKGADSTTSVPHQKGPQKLLISQESFEFERVLTNILGSSMINEPKLWFIFGLALEYLRQFRDSNLAYKVAFRLMSGNKIFSDNSSKETKNTDANSATISTRQTVRNFHSPLIRYIKLRVQYARDYRTAIQSLGHYTRDEPQNFELNPMLSLLMSAQPNANQSHLSESIQIISSLEAHSSSHKNPSLGYNQLASRCKLDDNVQSLDLFNLQIGDDIRTNLNFLLTKSYIVINNIVQNSTKSLIMYKSHLNDENDDLRLAIYNQLDKLVASLRNSEATCWASASFWNNLAVCYLMERKFVACLSCLFKAQQIDPLDWRISFNTGLACLHVGLAARALVNLNKSSRLYLAQYRPDHAQKAAQEPRSTVNPLITTLIAICHDKLDDKSAARRYHVETVRERTCIPILSLVSYLIFVHRLCQDRDDDDELKKLKIHLLDTLEQLWFQRNQNDPQFNKHLLTIASQIGNQNQQTADAAHGKSLAWTKLE